MASKIRSDHAVCLGLLLFSAGAAAQQHFLSLAPPNAATDVRVMHPDFASVGEWVADLGDINGDGLNDIAVGEATSATGAPICVLFGTDQGFLDEYDCSQLTGVEGFSVTPPGSTVFRGFGPAGDFDGDGFDDLYIIIDTVSTVLDDVRVLRGTDTGFPATVDLNTFAAAATITLSDVASSVTGRAVCSMDFNGDTLDDLVIGDYLAGGVTSRDGALYVLYGQSLESPLALDLGNLSPADGVTLTGAGANAGLGRSCAGLGDIDGDQRAELATSAPFRVSQGSPTVGAIFAIHGQDFITSGMIDVSTLNGSDGFLIGGDDMDPSLGSIRSLGDINDDGEMDLGVSLDVGEEVQIIFGGNWPVASPNSLDAVVQQSGGFVLESFNEIASLTGGADINGDGIADLAYRDFISISVQAGRSEWPDPVAVGGVQADDGFTISGPGAGSEIRSVRLSEDVNGDGVGETVVGVVGADSGAYLLFGQQADLSSTVTGLPSELRAGENYTFQIRIDNAGPSEAGFVKTVVDLPGPLFFASGTGMDWACSRVGSRLSCFLSSLIVLDAATSTTLDISAFAPLSGDVGTFDVSTRAAARSGDPMLVDNDVELSVPLLRLSDLGLSSSNTSVVIDFNQAATFAFEVTNNGPSPVFESLVTADLGSVLDQAVWTCTPTTTGASCPASGTETLVVPVALEAGSTVRIDISGALRFDDPASLAVGVSPELGVEDSIDPNNQLSFDLRAGIFRDSFEN